MTSTGVIRPLDMHDLASVLAIEQRAYAQPWTERQLQESLAGEHVVWGLFEDGQLAAYLIWMRVLDELHILNVATDPARQRRGHARRLCEQLLDCARGDGVHHVFLEVRASNTGAQALYLSLGLDENGRRRNYYPAAAGVREDAILMGMSW